MTDLIKLTIEGACATVQVKQGSCARHVRYLSRCPKDSNSKWFCCFASATSAFLNYSLKFRVFMAALRCKCGHYIFVLFLLLSFFFFSSPNLSRRRLDVYHTATHGVALVRILRCRSETCCMRLAGNAGPKIAKNSPSGHHRTTLSDYIFATKARIDNRKKNLLNSNVSPRVLTIWWTSAH